jgi:hypothetical protein
MNKITEASCSKTIVHFDMLDSDAHTVDYHLAKVKRFWRLTFVDDHSL